ncbi:MAG: energy transducer TonB [Muribaculaceae bacterium]|nr:energy transducer TonB [Muribaculaceae bacterium]
MKKNIILFTMVIAIINIANAQIKLPTIPSDLTWPSITEETKDAAYEAPASKLVGTWISKNHELTFNSDGTCILKVIKNGLDFFVQGKGTWSKKGDNLFIKIAPTSWTALIADKEAYNQLSARKKADTDEAFKIINSQLKSGGGERLDAEGKISFLNSDFLYYTYEGWYVKKNSLPKLETEAKEKAEAKARAKAEAEAEAKAEAEARAREQEELEARKIYNIVDENAQFPGGQVAFNKWLSKNIRYPEAAQQNNIQGRVLVKIIIEKDGSISDAEIQRGVDIDLDREALRLAKKMPNWIPGKINKEAVRSYANFPVTFKLTN